MFLLCVVHQRDFDQRKEICLRSYLTPAAAEGAGFIYRLFNYDTRSPGHMQLTSITFIYTTSFQSQKGRGKSDVNNPEARAFIWALNHFI